MTTILNTGQHNMASKSFKKYSNVNIKKFAMAKQRFNISHKSSLKAKHKVQPKNEA